MAARYFRPADAAVVAVFPAFDQLQVFRQRRMVIQLSAHFVRHVTVLGAVDEQYGNFQLADLAQ
jgi:hypothetical protein